ncbi:MAG TPA: PAS domain S-box protein, partial [Actinomycetota bacterium]|nr:PAS domain S-box protein [Actinomycetota bacterium]
MSTSPERDRSEQFADEAARLAAIIQSSHDAIYSKDTNAIIRSWNPAAEILYGYREDEVLGRPLSILVPEHRKGEEIEILNRILEGDRVHHYETERVRKDGSLVAVVISVSPLRDQDGEVVGASVNARDVSERNRAREMETRLQKLEFVTFVAHELRTPMTAIATAARLLEDMSELPEDTRRVIDVIVRQTGSAERLVRDLLDLSRLESGRFRVELQDVSLAGLV